MYSKSVIAVKLLSLFEYEEANVLDKLILVSGIDRKIPQKDDMTVVIPVEIPMLSEVISKMILASEGEKLAEKLLALADHFVCFLYSYCFIFLHINISYLF